jgi:hypothetical protein
MKYKPTPRDLFNPPPQALWPVEILQDNFDEIRAEMWGHFPDCSDRLRQIIETLVDFAEELARRTGSVK